MILSSSLGAVGIRGFRIIMKLINLRKFCRKMHSYKSLLINAWKNSLNTCLSKGHKFLLKKELRIIILYLGKISQIVKTRLTSTMNKYIKFCKLRVIFQFNNRLKSYFCFKDFVPELLRSSLIYKFLCGSCTATHIGKIYRHFKVRVSENQRVSPRTSKPLKSTLSTSVRDHMFVYGHK